MSSWRGQVALTAGRAALGLLLVLSIVRARPAAGRAPGRGSARPPAGRRSAWRPGPARIRPRGRSGRAGPPAGRARPRAAPGPASGNERRPASPRPASAGSSESSDTASSGSVVVASSQRPSQPVRGAASRARRSARSPSTGSGCGPASGSRRRGRWPAWSLPTGRAGRSAPGLSPSPSPRSSTSSGAYASSARCVLVRRIGGRDDGVEAVVAAVQGDHDQHPGGRVERGRGRRPRPGRPS